ncbi:MAG: Rieske (2Fe-2S) protein [Planctomycetes bacterium]|nr:Rieske (2Fe-2S) protein [Planctomycetota bacterium]
MNAQPDAGGSAVTRRDFSGALLGAASAAYAASLALPVCRYLAAGSEAGGPEVRQVVLPKAAVQVAPGSVLYFTLGHEPGLLIHHSDDTWSAFGAYCSHLRCTVLYQPESDRFFCPCHEGVFDPRSGQNLAGPPAHPLERLDVAVNGEDLLISRIG